MYKRVLAVVLAAAILLITGCDRIVLVKGELSSDETVVTESSSQIPDSSEDFVSPYPVIVNKVEFDRAPERVVSLTPAYTEIIYEIGYGDSIVGVCDYCDYPEEVKDKERVESGAAPDIGKILQLKADTVITATPIVQKSKIALESKGIRVLVIPTAESLEQLKFIYEIFGSIFAGNDKGRDLADSAYEKINSCIAETQKRKKISFVYITAALSPAGGNTLESDVLSLFGENIAKGGKGYDFDKSKLCDNQPEYIFLSDDFSFEDLSSDEVYSQLTAVNEGKVIIIPNIYFERPSARLADLLLDICKKLPEKPAAESKPEEGTDSEAESADSEAESADSEAESTDSEAESADNGEDTEE